MRTIFRTTNQWVWHTTLCILSLSSIANFSATASAEGIATAAAQDLGSQPHRDTGELKWIELAPSKQVQPVRIWFAGQRMTSGSDCYVITHGMGGTTSGDRFHQLAAAIHLKFPRACVLRVDWSEWSSAKLGVFFNPWKVAGKIDQVGDQVARLLKSEAIDPACTIFIGESYGNWVNARVAHQLRGVQGILALNPANETGGYTPPDLRKLARRSWSFHTYSPFDTTLEIANGDLFLETPQGASPTAQHIHGIQWLAERLAADDLSWLKLDKELPAAKPGAFRGRAMLNGELDDVAISRTRPEPPSNAPPALASSDQPMR